MNRRVRNIILRSLILLFFAGFVVLVVMAKNTREDMKINQLVIKIDQKDGFMFLNKKQINELLLERFDISGKIDMLLLERMERYLRRIPQVENVHVFTDNLGTLTVNIQQRTPVARVINAQGKHFYLDNNGLKFNLSPNYTAKVPLITGVIPETFTKVDTIKTKVLKDALYVINYAAKNPFWSAQIAEIHVNEYNEMECIPRMGHQLIYLGDTSILDDKFRRVDIFYNEVLNRVGWDTFNIIGVQFKNQIICK